jgi:hypothetical protein
VTEWWRGLDGVNWSSGCDRLRFHLRIEEKTMTSDEYEKLQTVDRERFMECPQCGEILSLEELLLHLAYKHPRSERLD